MKRCNPYYAVILGIAAIFFAVSVAAVLAWPVIMLLITGDWAILILYPVMFGLGFLFYMAQRWEKGHK